MCPAPEQFAYFCKSRLPRFLTGCSTETLRLILGCLAAKWVLSDARNALTLHLHLLAKIILLISILLISGKMCQIARLVSTIKQNVRFHAGICPEKLHFDGFENS